MILTPGLFDIPAAEYHADPAAAPSLSASIAKVLLEQSPAHARARHPRLCPQPADDTPTRPMEIGTVAHKIALGKGREVVVIEADNYMTKAAKETRAAVYGMGQSPILAPDHEKALAAAQAFLSAMPAHPDLAWAFEPAGRSEVVAIWQEGDVWCRIMCDRLRVEGDRAVIVDLKFTQDSAHPTVVAKRIFSMGYDFSGGFYRRGIAHLFPEVRHVEFLLATTEVDAPHGSSVVDLHPAVLSLAEKKIMVALGLWSKCLRTGRWPSYPTLTATAELPSWVESAWLEREANEGELYELGREFARPVREGTDVAEIAG